MKRHNAIKAAVCCLLFAVGVAACLIAPQCALAASWSSWSDYKQASCYGGPSEPWETVTATGKQIGPSSKYVAVPMNRVISKKCWKKLNPSQKKRFFFYGEKLQIKHGKKTLTVTVQDCGGFSGYYGIRKGKKVERLFDLTPGVYRHLKVDGLGFVRFRYEVVKL